nr:hypothetical protein CFP56_69176 [Quercus suber]
MVKIEYAGESIVDDRLPVREAEAGSSAARIRTGTGPSGSSVALFSHCSFSEPWPRSRGLTAQVMPHRWIDAMVPGGVLCSACNRGMLAGWDGICRHAAEMKPDSAAIWKTDQDERKSTCLSGHGHTGGPRRPAESSGSYAKWRGVSSSSSCRRMELQYGLHDVQTVQQAPHDSTSASGIEPTWWDTRLACVGRLFTPDWACLNDRRLPVIAPWAPAAHGFTPGLFSKSPRSSTPSGFQSRSGVGRWNQQSTKRTRLIDIATDKSGMLFCLDDRDKHSTPSSALLLPQIVLKSLFVYATDLLGVSASGRCGTNNCWPRCRANPITGRCSDKETDEHTAAASVAAPPLIIVSAQGHNDESRRIVRAQAARASAAQSRVTRAKNREDRTRESPQSPPQRVHGRSRDPKLRREPRPQSASASSSSPAQLSAHDTGSDTTSRVATAANSAFDSAFKPMTQWIVALLNLSAAAVFEGTATLTSASQHDTTDVSRAFPSPRSPDSVDEPPDYEISGLRLPVALPRGFAALQQRIQISSAMLELLSRTACVDLASPGVERRLHQLLFDLIIVSAGTALSSVPANGHPIQGHLRVNMPLDGVISLDKYTDGFHAAWSEMTLLDRQCLDDEKSAEVALWAMFIIGVTTGGRATYVSQRLHTLLAQLQLRYWDAVRRVLLEFIYPVSFLDQPCEDFYRTLYHVQPDPV